MGKWGKLVIFISIPYKDMNGRRTGKRIVLHTDDSIQEQQAKGLLLDFRGMNPALKHELKAEWQAHSVAVC